MKFNNREYEYLRWFVITVLPAFMTMIGTIGTAVQWEHTDLTLTVLGAITAFIGSSMNLSSSNYHKDQLDNPFTEIDESAIHRDSETNENKVTE
ncbi:phage holin [Eremococcus coleocola]|uniref:phage holin n=1 Tax=Eremococcus coleocola TaxID=88132 RepID=UPI000686CEB0|nr:phage holin [Eremococcus coleocola]